MTYSKALYKFICLLLYFTLVVNSARRQDLLRRGAKLESSLGFRKLTANFTAGCSGCSLTTGNSVVTNAVLIERAVSC